MTRINRNFSHIVPREIESDMRFIKFLSLRDLMIIVCLVMISNNFIGVVHPKLQLFYFLFTILAGLFLVMPAYKDNAGKKNVEVMFLILLKKRFIYYSIDDPIEEEREGIYFDETKTAKTE